MVYQWALFNEIVEDGMLTGYLLQFCRESYCAENFEFLLAVKKFHYLFAADSWTEWQSLDRAQPSDALYTDSIKEFDSMCNDALKSRIEKEMENIWATYLDPTNASAEVCLPYDVVENTKRRMKEYKAYGPDVFAEATLEPSKCLVRDIMPRYMTSEQYEDMLEKKQARLNLPDANKLVIPAPSIRNRVKIDLSSPEMMQAYINTIDNYVTDCVLYNQLLTYLKRIIASENLLVLRAIDVFEHCMVTPEEEELAIDIAWIIYNYFLSIGSAYEISISKAMLYDISRKMCLVESGMFAGVVASTRAVLEEHLSQFRTSPEYGEIPELLKLRDASIASGNDVDSTFKEQGVNSLASKKFTPFFRGNSIMTPGEQVVPPKSASFLLNCMWGVQVAGMNTEC